MNNQTVDIEEALQAYGILRSIHDRLAHLEATAHVFYAEANEAHDAGDTKRRALLRDKVNKIMEQVTGFKQIMM